MKIKIKHLLAQTLLTVGSCALAPVVATQNYSPELNPSVYYEMVPLGTYASGVFNEGAAEIVAFDPQTNRVFVINADAVTVDVLDIADPTRPHKVGAIDVTSVGNVANSVAVDAGVVVVAVEASVKQETGSVAFFNTSSLELIAVMKVGALPDALTFSADSRYLLVANEGEPNDTYTVDPEGSVSIIDLIDGVSNATVRHVTFERFNDQAERLKAKGVRIFGPGASVAQDLEPEYIATTEDGTAYVTLQENNALALIDIASAKVRSFVPLGYKDHSLPGNTLDVSDVDDRASLRRWRVFGMYQPDAIASFKAKGQPFLITANEGDSRDYAGFSEEARVASLALDAHAFPDADTLKVSDQLGRLKTTNTLGDVDGDGDIDQLFSFGGRSFSIWNSEGALVFDSGNDFETITARFLPEHFNSDDEEANTFDGRSDDKGPEPEGVVTGLVGGRQLAFIGLERVGGVMIYDATNPVRPVFQSYVNTRNFDVDIVTESGSSNPEAGDIGPEGIAFISQEDSPTGHPLLVVGSDASGTTTVFEFHKVWRPEVVGASTNP